MKVLLSLCLFGLSLLPAAMLNAAPDPSSKGTIPPVQAVKGHLWKCMRMGSFEMTGEFRTDKKSYPITLHTDGNEMLYTFTSEPLQIRVVISPTQSTIQKRASTSDAWTDVTGRARLQTILGTDVTYEDLGLEFLRWEPVEPVGTDTLIGIKTWAFECTPANASQFSKVRYWLTQAQCAFMRLDGYNSKGEVIKREEVTAITNIRAMTVFKEIVISSIIPGRNISASRTRITIRNTKVIRELAPDKPDKR
ncbi:MAG TPA: outer membrane lipoprotein-sorting protein [Candidatus Methylacidiphilales bacterium]|nr:outer membrane lipoprotein-sorting protein [Candidatus Methylacidiphilales bacterium]